MVTHKWFVRGKHTCGHVWTTGPSQSVVCACNEASISNGVLIGLDEVTNEEEFHVAVAADLGLDVNEVEVVKEV